MTEQVYNASLLNQMLRYAVLTQTVGRNGLPGAAAQTNQETSSLSGRETIANCQHC